MAAGPSTVDGYIAQFPDDVQAVLQEVRRTMHAAVPGAEEVISYQIPTLRRDGKAVVHFAGWREHVSVYPIPAGDERSTKRSCRTVRGRARCGFRLPSRYPTTSSAGWPACSQPGRANGLPGSSEFGPSCEV